MRRCWRRGSRCAMARCCLGDRAERGLGACVVEAVRLHGCRLSPPSRSLVDRAPPVRSAGEQSGISYISCLVLRDAAACWRSTRTVSLWRSASRSRDTLSTWADRIIRIRRHQMRKCENGREYVALRPRQVIARLS
jgi:hypothetical protein